MPALEKRERSQGVGDAAQATLRNGREQETIPMIRYLNQQRLRGSQRLGKLLLPEQRANPRELRGSRRGDRLGVRRLPPPVCRRHLEFVSESKG